MGFEVSRKEAHFDANFGVARWEPAYPSKGVSIYPGRASGKYFLVDGDALDIEPTAGWVTVDLFEEDVYPLWLGLFIP
jgi:predicted oxidoreductase